ncbi:Gastricsin [Paramicrosporidium saccamoebae]|uniref:Gastricsin n=1 Tax=Paramicrosporidium saccamoebae TaxID=1246581 RepID=A0A2H9TH36_9FUNG|nr:Gastricsin [Paramicrosporidium saccamoebae]
MMKALFVVLLSFFFEGCLASISYYLVELTEESDPKGLSIPINLYSGSPYEAPVYLSLLNSVCWVASTYCYTADCLNLNPYIVYNGEGFFSKQLPEQVYTLSAFGSQITGASVEEYCILPASPAPYPEFILNRINALRVMNYGTYRLPGVFGFGPGNLPNRRITPLVDVLGSSTFSIVLTDDAHYLVLGDQIGVPYRGSALLTDIPLYNVDDTWNYEIADFGTNTGSTVFTGLTGIAVLSTDSYPIEIPKAAGLAMATALGATVVTGEVDTYTILCSSVPSMGSIIFETIMGTISLSGFQIVNSNVGMCTFKVVGKDATRNGMPLWTMGVDFLASFYTTFNVGLSNISFYVPATSS